MQTTNNLNMMLEITMISAQGIKNTTSSFSLLSHRLKPFITITTFPSPTYSSSSSSSSGKSIKGPKICHVYTTRVDNEGGSNPTWHDNFYLTLDPTFFTSQCSCVYLQLYTMRALMGRALLGWIQIPAYDIFDGHKPIGSAHHLSYQLLEKDGSRGHGVVNVALRLVGEVPLAGCLAAVDTCRTSIGIPVMTCRRNQMDNMNSVQSLSTIKCQGGKMKKKENKKMTMMGHAMIEPNMQMQWCGR